MRLTLGRICASYYIHAELSHITFPFLTELKRKLMILSIFLALYVKNTSAVESIPTQAIPVFRTQSESRGGQRQDFSGGDQWRTGIHEGHWTKNPHLSLPYRASSQPKANSIAYKQ